jgi:uncharacterized protein (TIGR02453 family)
MIEKATLQFLSSLKKNNNKAWFDEHREHYLAAKENFELFVQQVINGIASFDETVASLEAKKCIFRINRDVRFSKDKSPYKTNFGASINRGGKKIMSAGYYFQVEPGNSFIAGGIYMPMPPDLNKIRQEIDYHFKEWKTIVEAKAFKKMFPTGVDGIESLVRPPKGYDSENPAIDYIRMKSFIVSRKADNNLLVSKTLLKETVNTFAAMKPLIDFLNRAMD